MPASQPGDGTGGVQCFDPSSPPLHQWTQYTIKDGLGDDNGYAIACDKQDRIWVGHLNHGVSVFNHNSKGHWQCYKVVAGLSRPDTLSGPIGERVFAIKCCPTDGDIWIATNCGLARYSDSKQTWTYLTRADGLPSDQGNALAFDKDGNLYVGTQCDGIAMADAKDDYKCWRVAIGPEQDPATPTGDGLPTNLINDVLVANDGTIYAATDAGLAWSKDRGASWRHMRGASAVTESDDIGRNTIHESRPSSDRLREDHVTCLADFKQAEFFVGYWRSGFSRLSPQLGDPADLSHCEDFSKRYITAFSIDRIGNLVCSTYGSGLISSGHVAACDSKQQIFPGSQTEKCEMPSSARSPTDGELLSATERLINKRVSSQSPVIPLPDDWRIEGEWLGRVGRYWAALAGFIPVQIDFQWGINSDSVLYHLQNGPHHFADDVLNYWTAAARTADARGLEMPAPYATQLLHLAGNSLSSQNRRITSWDDRGEIYSPAFDGPDLYCSLRVPTGKFILSLYELSEDGHSERNRFRDFSITIKHHDDRLDFDDISAFDAEPALSRARAELLWGGVYKRFAVAGPIDLTIKVGRNQSINSRLCALMLDTAEAFPAQYGPMHHEVTTATQPGGSSAEAGGYVLQQLAEAEPLDFQCWAYNRVKLAVLGERWCRAIKSPNLADRADGHQFLFEAGLYAAWEAEEAAWNGRTPRDVELAMTVPGSVLEISGNEANILHHFVHERP